jgi:hypothetical protein
VLERHSEPPIGPSADAPSTGRGEGEPHVVDAGSAPSEPFLYDGFASYATDPDRDLVRDVEAFVESLHRNSLIERSYRRRLEFCVDVAILSSPAGQRSARSRRNMIPCSVWSPNT